MSGSSRLWGGWLGRAVMGDEPGWNTSWGKTCALGCQLCRGSFGGFSELLVKAREVGGKKGLWHRWQPAAHSGDAEAE